MRPGVAVAATSMPHAMKSRGRALAVTRRYRDGTVLRRAASETLFGSGTTTTLRREDASRAPKISSRAWGVEGDHHAPHTWRK